MIKNSLLSPLARHNEAPGSDDMLKISIYRFRYRYIVSSKKYQIFLCMMILKNIAIYRDTFDNITIFSTDFSQRCVTGKKDDKWDGLMVS